MLYLSGSVAGGAAGVVAAGVVVVVVVAVDVDPLFCRLMRSISSSDICRCAVVGAVVGRFGCWTGAFGCGGATSFFSFFGRSCSCNRFITRGESANRMIPLKLPRDTNSVSRTRSRSFSFSFSLNRTLLCSLSESSC